MNHVQNDTKEMIRVELKNQRDFSSKNQFQIFL